MILLPSGVINNDDDDDDSNRLGSTHFVSRFSTNFVAGDVVNCIILLNILCASFLVVIVVL